MRRAFTTESIALVASKSLRTEMIWACSTASTLRSLTLAADAMLTRPPRAHCWAIIGANLSMDLNELNHALIHTSSITC